MNKLTKYGVSALCGSLAAVASANAGELTVTGGADVTWVNTESTTNGNPLGIGSNYTMAGSGELDNGWSVDLTIAMTNANAYSNTSVAVGVPGIGSILLNQGGSGTGIQRLDDITPTVWEETDGAGLSIGATKIKGTSAGATIEVTPTDLVPAGLTARFAYSADADGSSSTSDKGTGGDSGVLGAGWDLTVSANSELLGVEGLEIYGGISQVDQYQNSAAYSGDSEETVIGIKYAMGSFTAGWQQTDDDTGRASTNTNYENTSYGITFSVNDDLSIGYGHVESDRSSTTGVTAEADSFQIAYTMGGASFRIAEVQADNIAYVAADDRDATIISMGLAF
jgi:outer membrane protein OmpU